MTLYEIDQQLLDLVDQETGELLDYEAFEKLQMERQEKLEGIALWVKELAAQAKAIHEEIKALTERKEAAERKRERLIEYLTKALEGAKLTTPKVSVSYRRSSAVEITNAQELVAWCRENGYRQYVTQSEPVVSKSDAKKIIQYYPDGIPGAKMVQKTNTVIK